MIEFTEEQTMLLDTAAEFCRNESPMEVVRGCLDASEVNRPQWQQMSELGWLGINIPEQFGGLGLGLSSVVPVAESMGRYLMASPFISTVLAAETLNVNGNETQQANWLPRLASGAIAAMALTEEDGSWVLDQISATGEQKGEVIRLSGTKCFVTDADAADVLIASVTLDNVTRLVLLEPAQLPAPIRETVIDQTRRSFRVDLDGVEVTSDRLLPGTDFRRLELAALLLLVAEMSGGLPSVLKLIVEYIDTRKAFGRTIGSYQSLKHPAADMLLGVEAVRSHLYHAATLLNDDSGVEAESAVRMAKALAAETYAFAGDRAVQFHGGFGFTFECDAQLYLRRALWCQYQFGDEHYHRQLLTSLLLD